MLYAMIISGIITTVGCLKDEAPKQMNFVQPEKVCELPAELMEVSGLTDVDNRTIACVQDERGIIYFYDLENCSVKHKVEFAGTGDFEGLTRVGDDYYSLRSDGVLFEVKMKGNKPSVRQIETKIPAGDNEGLAFDAKRNRLLIAPKAKFTDKDFGKTHRAIYAYDLAAGKMLDKPVLEVNMADAEKFLLNKEGVELPKKKKSGEVNFQFGISSIALHPEKDQYFILVTSAKLVVVTDDKGRVIDALPLDEGQFPQPEGITFLDNGQLVISTEGAKGKPVIGVFKL